MNTRLLRFRLWDGFSFANPDVYLKTLESPYLNINDHIANDPSIWMQFTGIIDKKGRDIYECDEVIATPTRTTEPSIRGVVEYDDLAARFVIRNERGLTKLDSNVFVFEVVGNAFQ